MPATTSPGTLGGRCGGPGLPDAAIGFPANRRLSREGDGLPRRWLTPGKRGGRRSVSPLTKMPWRLGSGMRRSPARVLILSRHVSAGAVERGRGCQSPPAYVLVLSKIIWTARKRYPYNLSSRSQTLRENLPRVDRHYLCVQSPRWTLWAMCWPTFSSRIFTCARQPSTISENIWVVSTAGEQARRDAASRHWGQPPMGDEVTDWS